SQPSSLLGDLQANGRIFLLNPQGVLIGSEARIDTAGFLASTLDVANADFLAGADLSFAGDSAAAVVNLGRITATAGDVFLIGRKAVNEGSLWAPGGTVGFAAGSEVVLAQDGIERVCVQGVTGAAGEDAKEAALLNAGTIEAVTAELKAAS